MARSFFAIMTIVLFSGITTLYAQEKKEVPETKSKAATISVKGLDEFHELLHPLIHEAYPEKDFASIRKALPNLVKAAETMAKATLSKEMTPKKAEYRKESKKLVKQLKAMKDRKDRLSDEQLGKQFMEMHDTFEGIMEMTQ